LRVNAGYVKKHDETIDHLTSGCPILAKNEYLMRHDKVYTHLHYSICKVLGIETTDKWYKHLPKPVYKEGDVTVLWNQAVHTVREVTANRPDKIIKNKKEKTCTLIDVAIPTDRNIVQKDVEIQEFMYRGYDIVQWQPTSDILTRYISSRPMACTSGCFYSF
jgi:hypothetical protein